jgi:hypothetical protein
MPSTAWRLLLLPLVLLAFVLLGAPDFPAFQRAVQKAFTTSLVTSDDGRDPGPRVRNPGSDPGSSSPALNPDVLQQPSRDSHSSVPASGAKSPLRVERDASTPAPGRGILVPLYVSFAVLQALDAHSTLRALDAGASEANPLMERIAHNPPALVAIKAGVAASTIYLVDKVRVKSRGAAIALMAALDSLYATIVAQNYGSR